MKLHLEMYSNPNDAGSLSGSGIYRRRSDLVDPTSFLNKTSI